MAQPSQRRAEVTRRRILDAASREFAVKGFSGGSMRAIARECDIKLALVQYHFKDKLTLWEKVLEDVLDSFYQRADMQRVADRRPSEQLAVYLEAIIRHAATDEVFVGIMSHARISQTPDNELFRKHVGRHSHESVELIRAAQADGEVVPGDPVVIFYMMVGAALRIFMLAADIPDLTGRHEAATTLLDEQVRTCLGLFLHPVGGDVSEFNQKRVPPNPQEDKLESDEPSTVYLLASLDRVIRRSLEQELKAVDISQGQMMALISIADQPGLSSVELAHLLSVSPQTVMLFVKSLEEKRLVRRKADRRKHRALPIMITPAGKKVLARLAEMMEGTEATLMDAFSFEERNVLRRMLSRLLKRHRPNVMNPGQRAP